MSTISHLFNTTVLVQSVTQTQSSTGGQIKTLATKHAALPCLIERLSGGKQPILGREGVIITHMLYTDVFDITETDIIIQGSIVFDTDISDDVQGRGQHVEIQLIERR